MYKFEYKQTNDTYNSLKRCGMEHSNVWQFPQTISEIPHVAGEIQELS